MSDYTVPKNIEYLLFDMDGTLVNTEPLGPQTFIEQLKQYGVDPDKDEYDLFVRVWKRDGTNIKEVDFLTSIVEKYKISLPPKDYIANFYQLYETNITQAEALPGVETFLSAASKRRELKLALVTASKLSQVQAILHNHGWSHYFDAIVSEENITRHKPDPEPFLVGMEKLNANSSQTIIFEDSKNGSLAGKAAHCTVIGVRAGNATPQDLTACDQVVESFARITFS